MPIHIRAEDEETLSKLKELGFDAHIITDDPLADALFYLSRMNSKLDNLGQIRHLHKIMQAVLKMRSAAETQQIYYANLNRKEEARVTRLKALWNELWDLTNVPENERWRKYLPSFSSLYDPDEGSILRAFHVRRDEHYNIYALEPDTVYVKSIIKDAPSQPLGVDDRGTSVRLGRF